MTVEELIKELQKFPPTTRVVTEGCDCWGEIESLVLSEDLLSDDRTTEVVLLERP